VPTAPPPAAHDVRLPMLDPQMLSPQTRHGRSIDRAVSVPPQTGSKRRKLGKTREGRRLV